jgi:uncharacterized OsmC-like protein
MSITETTRGPKNGVDVPTLFATLDAVKASPGAAKFQFRAVNEWVSGTHSRSTIDGYHGVFAEQQHVQPFVLDGDHPVPLVGDDQGPTPVEVVLHALASCLTAGLVNMASTRGITLTEVRSTLEGDIDLRGILGLSDEVRNGYEGIKVRFTVKGDADPEVLRGLVERSRARSAVYDILTGRTPVSIEVDAG